MALSECQCQAGSIRKGLGHSGWHWQTEPERDSDSDLAPASCIGKLEGDSAMLSAFFKVGIVILGMGTRRPKFSSHSYDFLESIFTAD